MSNINSTESEIRQRALMSTIGWMFGLTWLLIIGATSLILWRLP